MIPPSASIALLRGVNVGGKNKLPMADLVRMFREVGCARVRTYIQSGNVVFDAAPALAKQVSGLVSLEIEKRCGFRTTIVVRSIAELGTVLRTNPFLKTHADPATLHVLFLADLPTAGQIAALDPHWSPPDAFAVVGREVFLCLPNGVARSKLTNAYFDSKLATVGTARNWRTVTKLVEMGHE